MTEPLTWLFSSSEVLIWNFDDIEPRDNHKNIQQYFEDCEASGLNPRSPAQRELFNRQVLRNTTNRYLIGRYLEDRRHVLAGSHIAREGRTHHLAIDVFTAEQEELYAPTSGTIVRSGYEEGDHGYGNYVILKPMDDTLPYIFFGHLAYDRVGEGPVNEGQRIGRLGHHEQNENGGWSTHLHLQLMTELPPLGEAPIGYTSEEDLEENRQRFPDPLTIFPDWEIQR